MRVLLLALALALLVAGQAVACPHAPDDAEYRIHHEAYGEVGRHVIPFACAGDELIVETRIEGEVTLLMVPIFQREARYHEVWRGAIVNVGSVNGLLALGNPGYSAATAGLLNFTKALATEYGPQGIRANMVSRGTVRTESPSWQKRLALDPQVFEKLARWYPVGRVGRPDDIAAAIAFLAADEAAFVNGANLVVDGGLTAGIAPMIAEFTLETR